MLFMDYLMYRVIKKTIKKWITNECFNCFNDETITGSIQHVVWYETWNKKLHPLVFFFLQLQSFKNEIKRKFL